MTFPILKIYWILYLEKLGIVVGTETFQKAGLLGTARILRRVLNITVVKKGHMGKHSFAIIGCGRQSMASCAGLT